ncbi:sterol desaturase family protein [Labrenzia suaedae]|uniref:Sterol desaturase family protein n=2 Tax=Roseibium litorale TaxID=2803841 RepID=A0ABR9CS93_9HYPH|nr:sterol desaturase family protein [Roseibium litorale]
MSLAEVAWPRRKLSVSRKGRWPVNWAIVLLDTAIVRLLFPLGGVGLAVWAGQVDTGLLNQLELSPALEGGAAFLLLDLAVWFQHWAAHKVPLLWRVHQVHHADGDMDVTTALRFHPVEILLSFFWKGAVIIALGASPEAVLVFEIALNGTAMFNHANARLPGCLDSALRFLVVTPDMHRVHHSAARNETDSNYGFCLSVWDRLFRTYVRMPALGHQRMTIGLSPEKSRGARRLGWSLLLPFRDNGRNP